MRKILVGILLVCVLLFSGCHRLAEDEVYVSLKGNALAGYTWQCVEEDLGCIELRDEWYETGDHGCAVGRAGACVFTYGPVEPGTVTLHYVYIRDWEDEEPVYTATYEFTVDEDMNLTMEVLEWPDYGEEMYW